jgi:FAD synthase
MERATIDRDTFVRPNARPSAGVPATLIAGTVTLGDGSACAATVSVGRRVTFYGRNGFRLVEAYLLDFSGDLYGQWVEVRLCSRLRLQRRFPDVDALIEQMRQDVEDTRAWAAALTLSDGAQTAAVQF